MQSIYVNEKIGQLNFPDDMDDAAIAEAIHSNFPELGENPLAPKMQVAEKSEPIVHPTTDVEPDLNLEVSDDSPFADAYADVESRTGISPDAVDGLDLANPGHTPFPEDIEGNGIGRAQTAVGQFAKGAGNIASGTMKSLAIANTSAMENLNEELHSIGNRGEKYEAGPPADPREHPLYKMGNEIDDWISNQVNVNPKYAEEFWTGKIPEGMGSMFSFVMANIAGRGALGKTGMSPAQAGTASTMATGAGAQASSVFEDALNNGADLETAYDSAKWGAVIGTSEALPIMMMLNRLDKGTGGTIRKAVVDMLKEGTEEAAQELFQTITTNAVAQGYYDPERGTWSGGEEGAAVGFTTGAIMSLFLSMIGLKNGRLLKKGEKPEVIQEEHEQRAQEDADVQAAEEQTILENTPPEPTQDEINAQAQGEAANDLKGFMEDERPAEEIITERQAQDAAAKIQAEEEASIADMAEQQQQAAELEQGLEQAELEGQIEQEMPTEIPEQAPNGNQMVTNQVPNGTGVAADPVKVETPEDVDKAASQSNPEPSDAQKEAGNYQKGHLKLHGLDVTIENMRGDTRSGKDAGGNPWEVTMPAHYGYIKRTEGADGDHVDVYIGEHPTSKQIFIVDQVDPDTGKFDEHKVIFGTDSLDGAGELYEGGFSDGRGSDRMGTINPMTIAQFKNWLKNGNTKKPFSPQPFMDGKQAKNQEQEASPVEKEPAKQKPEEVRQEMPVPENQNETDILTAEESKTVQDKKEKETELDSARDHIENSFYDWFTPKEIAAIQREESPSPYTEEGVQWLSDKLMEGKERGWKKGIEPETIEPEKIDKPVSTKKETTNTEKTDTPGDGVRDLNGKIIPPTLMVNIEVEVEGDTDTVTIEVEAAETMRDLQAKLTTYEKFKECLR